MGAHSSSKNGFLWDSMDFKKEGGFGSSWRPGKNMIKAQSTKFSKNFKRGRIKFEKETRAGDSVQ